MTPEAFNANLLNKIPQEWRISPDKLKLSNNMNIVQMSGILADQELAILQHDATALAAIIARGQTSSVVVATAYLKASAIAHQATGYLFDFFPAEALERARWLDEKLEQTGSPVGPLHGIPISLKGTPKLS